MTAPVLVIAQEDDLHTRAVVDEVQRLGSSAIVADLSQFPEHAQLEVSYTCCGDRDFGFRLDGERFDLSRCGGGWWRRPQQPRISDDIRSSTHRLFASNEASEALGGLWHALDLFWVNDPARDHVAHRKVAQLRVAQQCDLRLPDTMVTNDPDTARRFIDRHGYRQVIFKAFSALEEEWRETRILGTSELDVIDHVQYAPVIFQEYVEAVYDLRITVVGDEVFAAAIHSQETSYPVDFRMDMANARIEAVELPAIVRKRLGMFMQDLGLEYGAIDMRLRPDGEYVFLEINPAGQWLFIEEATDQPITAALARLLVTAGRDGRDG